LFSSPGASVGAFYKCALVDPRAGLDERAQNLDAMPMRNRKVPIA
jgi:hypothetical protein